uniref:Uncharacterized protein n=1 Tax=Clastoptera arizonana TaxID=38151 RepID=A0A1B6D7Q5_9HEMI
MSRFSHVLVLGFLATFVSAVPVSLLSDVKQAEMMSHARLSNKVKRAQEVIMFGNQQNRAGDGRAFALPRTDKRGMDLDENVLPDIVTDNPLSLIPPDQIYSSDGDNGMEEPKALPQYDKEYGPISSEPSYAQRLQNSFMKSDLYADPATFSEMRYYDMESRRKRDARAYKPSPMKRSRQLAASRTKRDISPEEFFLLVSLARSHRLNNGHNNRNAWPVRYKAVDSNTFDLPEESDDGSLMNDDDDDEEDDTQGTWLEPPPVPMRPNNIGEQWGRQRFSDDRHKRFMVTKRRQDGDMYALAQLLNGPRQREPGVPLYHRLIL